MRLQSTDTASRRRSIFCTCLFTLTLMPAAVPTGAQDASASIARALRILEEMERLLARIEARLAGSPRAATGSTPAAGEWVSLFDGKSLGGWLVTDFAGGGEVKVEPSFRGGAAIVVNMGLALSGFNWTREVPKTNYEIELETLRIDGNDFLCGLTFPVGESHASLILGGWGGGVVGISSIDGNDASENETTKIMGFPKDRWYKVRMRVTPDKLESWLDDKKVVDVKIAGRKISLRPGEISKSIPIGISTYQTSAAFRNIRLRRL